VAVNDEAARKARAAELRKVIARKRALLSGEPRADDLAGTDSPENPHEFIERQMREREREEEQE
jgi:hypothetical protein